MAKSKSKPNETINSKLSTKSTRISTIDPAEQSNVVYRNPPNYFHSLPSRAKPKWTVSRCLCIQFLVLLGLVTLAAITIPIVVIVLDSISSSPPCASTYSDVFTNGITPTTAQCTAWREFKNALTCATYSKVRMYGSNDPIGITSTDSSVATALAIALRYNTTITTVLNGVTWRVGACGSGYEISATGTICSCPTGYTIRPCIGSSNWGGINSATCGAATQTMSLYFE
ncbi:unnamed protein product [Adineta ricciae]|uniref:Uncharacterized protein n=2 Tax=Adineta ricciae TaxID=249248 RepID=A0A815M6Z3_ADIRI|nr:unnamed protein product [Adineta ricciae]